MNQKLLYFLIANSWVMHIRVLLMRLCNSCQWTCVHVCSSMGARVLKKGLFFLMQCVVASTGNYNCKLKALSIHAILLFLVCSFKLTKNILLLYCGRYFNIDLLIFKLKYIEGKKFESHYLICFRLLQIYDYSLKARFEDNKCSLFM